VTPSGSDGRHGADAEAGVSLPDSAPLPPAAPRAFSTESSVSSMAIFLRPVPMRPGCRTRKADDQGGPISTARTRPCRARMAPGRQPWPAACRSPPGRGLRSAAAPTGGACEGALYKCIPDPPPVRGNGHPGASAHKSARTIPGTLDLAGGQPSGSVAGPGHDADLPVAADEVGMTQPERLADAHPFSRRPQPVA
jgi:hypothetical protein